MGPTRVFVVDDHPLVREALRQLVGREDGLEFAGESDGTGDVAALVDAMRPHVVLMDYRLPGTTGDILTKALKERRPGLRVLGISSDMAVARERMIAAGVDAFLLKSDVASTLAMLRKLSLS